MRALAVCGYPSPAAARIASSAPVACRADSQCIVVVGKPRHIQVVGIQRD